MSVQSDWLKAVFQSQWKDHFLWVFLGEEFKAFLSPFSRIILIPARGQITVETLATLNLFLFSQTSNV